MDLTSLLDGTMQVDPDIDLQQCFGYEEIHDSDLIDAPYVDQKETTVLKQMGNLTFGQHNTSLCKLKQCRHGTHCALIKLKARYNEEISKSGQSAQFSNLYCYNDMCISYIQLATFLNIVLWFPLWVCCGSS